MAKVWVWVWVLVMAGLMSLSVRADDLALVLPVHAAQLHGLALRPASSATLTPRGVYWTFETPRATTTFGPRGEVYQTFRSPTATVTLLPDGGLVWTVKGR